MNDKVDNFDTSGLNLAPGIRPTARAIIRQEQQILLLRKDYGNNDQRYALPGGGQQSAETLEQALRRECLEEIGTTVEIVRMRHVADHFKPRDTQPPTHRQLLELLFECRVPDDYLPHNGAHPDKHQVAVLWVDLQRLPRLPLFPPYLVDCIAQLDRPGRPFYLGRV